MIRISKYNFSPRFFSQFAQPKLLVTFDYYQNSSDAIHQKLKSIEKVLVKNKITFPDQVIFEDHDICKQLAQMILALCKNLEIPCDQSNNFFEHSITVSGQMIRCDMNIQSIMPLGILELFKWIKSITLSDTIMLEETIVKSFVNLKSKVDQITFSTRERRILINESIKLRIPVTRLHRHYFLFGMAANGVQFDYSLTKNTSVIAAKMVRNKIISDAMLAMAAIPKPITAQVFNKQDCFIFLKKHGFPIVIKPADLDTGRGVFSNIISPEQLNQGFDYAKSFSKNVLIQKYIDGKEYRLFVLNGELVWCFERLYPIVIGDGRSSIRQLIEKENKKSLRIKENILIKLSSEVVRELDHQGLMLTSVPALNKKIKVNNLRTTQVGGLHRAANCEIHPDNKSLVERAAKIFDIDFCGVDLIISDIKISWRKTKSAVLEVNSQPQISYISHHLHGLLLKNFIKGSGRIPIFLICGRPIETDFFKKLIVDLESLNKKAAILDNGQVKLNQKPIFAKSTDEETAIKALKLEKDVDLIVLFVSEKHQFSKLGLYWDSFDGLMIEENGVAFPKCDLEFLARFCSGKIGINNKIDTNNFSSLKRKETYGSLNKYLKKRITVLMKGA